MDDATLSRLELERKIETLMDEIEFLKKLHDEVSDATSEPLQRVSYCRYSYRLNKGSYFLCVLMLTSSGNPRRPGECPDPAAENGGGQQLQAGPDWRSEGHQGSVRDHRLEEHAGI